MTYILISSFLLVSFSVLREAVHKSLEMVTVERQNTGGYRPQGTRSRLPSPPKLYCSRGTQPLIQTVGLLWAQLPVGHWGTKNPG